MIRYGFDNWERIVMAESLWDYNNKIDKQN